MATTMSSPLNDKLKSDNTTDRFAWQVAAAVFCRVILNTARRFAYPFAPAISRGLGVSLTAVTSIIAVNQASALLGLFFIFISWEFTFVTGLSLGTELIPGSRATMMSGLFAGAGLGRIVGALIGGHIWLAGGIVATAIVSTLASGIALASLIWGLHGWTKR